MFADAPQPGQFILSDRFSELHAELIFLAASDTDRLARVSPRLAKELVRLCAYVNFRLGDVETRLRLIEVLRRAGKQAEEMASPHFAGLLIKDFHVDLGSLMDSVAAVVIQATGGIGKKDRKKLPGFADIQKESKRSYRSRLPRPFQECIDDATKTWWHAVKTSRDALTHREYCRLVARRANGSLLFRIEDFDGSVLSSGEVLGPGVGNVTDLRKYTAVALVYVLDFLNELGNLLSTHLHVPLRKGLSISTGAFSGVPTTVDEVLRDLGT